MDKRIKIGIGAVCMSVLVLSLMLAFPSGPGGVKVNGIVSANPSFDNYTRIAEVNVDNSGTFGHVFTENNQTIDVDVGYTVTRLQSLVYLKKEYADNSEAAHANTRVYMIVKNPADATVYENYLSTEGGVTDEGTHWNVRKRDNTFTPFELTEGTWTIITKYEVYA